jgi:pimeloyl-ACP methyl ester carboxylesterase
MPTARNGDVSLYYELDGSGDPVAFVGDLGYGAWQWAWQYPAVAGPFAGLVSDTRGTGRSDAPQGPYSVADLAADLDAVLSDAGLGSVHLVGAGLGGLVCLHTALTGSRVESLTLFGTAARGGDIDLDPLFGTPDDRAALRRSILVALSDDFVEDAPETVDRIVDWRADEDAPRDAWDAQTAAVRAFDVGDRLYEITTPTLVVHGLDDAVWPVERGRALADGLPRGRFVAVEGAGHLVHVERPRRVNDELVGFLEAR